jgi:hypothetical protein
MGFTSDKVFSFDVTIFFNPFASFQIFTASPPFLIYFKVKILSRRKIGVNILIILDIPQNFKHKRDNLLKNKDK